MYCWLSPAERERGGPSGTRSGSPTGIGNEVVVDLNTATLPAVVALSPPTSPPVFDIEEEDDEHRRDLRPGPRRERSLLQRPVLNSGAIEDQVRPPT